MLLPSFFVLLLSLTHARSFVMKAGIPTPRGEQAQSRRAALSTIGGAFLCTTRAGASWSAAPTSIVPCPDEAACFSTANFNQLARYIAPWSYDGIIEGGEEAYEALAAVLAKSTQLTVIETDPKGLYVKCEAKSALGGYDDFEFLVKPQDKLLTFKTRTRNPTGAGPLTVGQFFQFFRVAAISAPSTSLTLTN
ncbi:unnamed protein product [Chrysoparadoxa australica]